MLETWMKNPLHLCWKSLKAIKLSILSFLKGLAMLLNSVLINTRVVLFNKSLKQQLLKKRIWFIRSGLLFQTYRYLAGIMSNPEIMLKLLLKFTITGQQLPSKEAMIMASLTILMSQQLQLSLIIPLGFLIV